MRSKRWSNGQFTTAKMRLWLRFHGNVKVVGLANFPLSSHTHPTISPSINTPPYRAKDVHKRIRVYALLLSLGLLLISCWDVVISIYFSFSLSPKKWERENESWNCNWSDIKEIHLLQIHRLDLIGMLMFAFNFYSLYLNFTMSS